MKKFRNVLLNVLVEEGDILDFIEAEMAKVASDLVTLSNDICFSGSRGSMKKEYALTDVVEICAKIAHNLKSITMRVENSQSNIMGFLSIEEK